MPGYRFWSHRDIFMQHRAVDSIKNVLPEDGSVRPKPVARHKTYIFLRHFKNILTGILVI
jgi:hypothetical protein